MIRIIGGKIILHSAMNRKVKFAYPIDLLNLSNHDGNVFVNCTGDDDQDVNVKESFDDILEAISHYHKFPESGSLK